MEVPLPWERLLWNGRPSLLARLLRRARGERYVLTDFRLVRLGRAHSEEIALQDIGEVHRVQSRVDRLIGTSTITVHSRVRSVARPGGGPPPIRLAGVRRGAPVAALLDLLSSEPHDGIDADAIRAALSWEPAGTTGGALEGIAALALIVIAVFGVAIGLHGKTTTATYAPDDAIYPNGEKRSRDAIVRFMETDVMPWARAMLGPIKGGADAVTCETCHGREAASREWRMPAVAALPEPLVRQRGWERYSVHMDAQMRNAIYGYLAESDKQARAAYMREMVLPGMARLLHRPAYDFTKTYDYNRSRLAFGCYHCHQVQ